MKDYVGKSIIANYFKGIEGLEGKLSFDENGLGFKSHKINIQKADIRIEYADMEKAELRGILLGLNVYTKDGTLHKFVVYGRKKVLEFLNSKIK